MAWCYGGVAFVVRGLQEMQRVVRLLHASFGQMCRRVCPIAGVLPPTTRATLVLARLRPPGEGQSRDVHAIPSAVVFWSRIPRVRSRASEREARSRAQRSMHQESRPRSGDPPLVRALTVGLNRHMAVAARLAAAKDGKPTCAPSERAPLPVGPRSEGLALRMGGVAGCRSPCSAISAQELCSSQARRVAFASTARSCLGPKRAGGKRIRFVSHPSGCARIWRGTSARVLPRSAHLASHRRTHRYLQLELGHHDALVEQHLHLSQHGVGPVCPKGIVGIAKLSCRLGGAEAPAFREQRSIRDSGSGGPDLGIGRAKPQEGRPRRSMENISLTGSVIVTGAASFARVGATAELAGHRCDLGALRGRREEVSGPLGEVAARQAQRGRLLERQRRTVVER